jgi:uncharacterized membrane protein
MLEEMLIPHTENIRRAEQRASLDWDLMAQPRKSWLRTIFVRHASPLSADVIITSGRERIEDETSFPRAA